jgi:hypothetical protein
MTTLFYSKLTNFTAHSSQLTAHSPLKTFRFFIMALLTTTFLMPSSTNAQVDTFVCDNGGFEEGFKYYTGSVTVFNYGSSSCNPQPDFFSPSALPTFRRFEIVSTGVDPITGYQKVLFESNALLLNSPLPHVIDPYNDCIYLSGVDRIVKRFKVTEANRFFTVWYSVVLANPDLHVNDDQPFFSIRCDLAPNNDLCFDGISFPTNVFYPFGECLFGEEPIKATDWACHRIFIPQNRIGQIATLEITAADCGQNAHFGYAYVDGICESCGGSSYGSGSIGFKNPNLDISCNRDRIIIHGSYTVPTISGNYTILDDFTVPGFTIFNKIIDPSAKTFRFEIQKSDFQSPNPSCRDVIAFLHFKNAGGDFLPAVSTNGIEVCFDDFLIPELEITVGTCNRNHPTNNLYSDDYYYVNVEISNADNIPWVLKRQLDDPYPDESGQYSLLSGTGNGIYNLGPFLIQEGSWQLILCYKNCTETYPINPPEFCSGCPQFPQIKISNIQCNPINGFWSYDIMIPNKNLQMGGCWFFPGGITREFNTTYTITVGPVSQFCITRQIKIKNDCNGVFIDCELQVDICPPKPCTNKNYEDCDLEAYIKKLNCINDGNGIYSYTVDLEVSGAGYPCYKIPGIAQGPYSNPLGPYNTDITLILYSCGFSATSSCDCPTTNCYKVLKIRKPEDCGSREGFGSISSRAMNQTASKVAVYPNPVSSDEFIIKSSISRTEFDIFNSSGLLLHSGVFKGLEHTLNIKLKSGLYLLRYKGNNGEYSIVKFVKL